MEEEAAVIHVDAAHHGGAVVADVALGVEEAGRELVDANPRPEQRHIIGAGQPEDQLLIRDARQHQPDVHAPLCRRLESFQHGLAHREVGRIELVNPELDLVRQLALNGKTRAIREQAMRKLDELY